MSRGNTPRRAHIPAPHQPTAEEMVSQLEASLPADVVSSVVGLRYELACREAQLAERQLIFCDLHCPIVADIARLELSYWEAQRQLLAEELGYPGNSWMAEGTPREVTLSNLDERVISRYLIHCGDQSLRALREMNLWGMQGPAALAAAYEYRSWTAQEKLIDAETRDSRHRERDLIPLSVSASEVFPDPAAVSA